LGSQNKGLPHRGKLEAVIEDFLDLLSPATNKPLSDFNSQERRRGRFGVISIDIIRMEGEFHRLLAGSDINTLDAKFNDIDKYLAATQAEYEDYVVGAVAMDQKHKERTLDTITRRFKEARG